MFKCQQWLGNRYPAAHIRSDGVSEVLWIEKQLQATNALTRAHDIEQPV